ncbi:MAG: endonuclease/exonuclease/phosphatase family protein [Planctomycetota bacterium]|nr:endonuclease/exonuclease/phosphatase family protein [Planctomycetota bacterium]MEC8652044.1 endonuclease/exonuclease/phosphatase family protein [Planctomycetota bacterium]MEC9048444.1 endonuclease/exonuclease/phosphatase family protein [Planctomycetota bacterium]
MPASRYRHLARLAVALTLLLLGCQAGPAGAASLRVVTWNIHHARGLDDRVDVARIAAELEALDADFVLLQEVDVGVRRSGGVDIPAELAAALGMHAAFEKNIPYQGGEYGNAILSRWPITSRANRRYQMLRRDEQRGLLTVTVHSPHGALAIGCTHIDSRTDDAERMKNVPEILETVAQRELFAVGGDFNDLPDSRVHRALSEALIDCWREAGAGTDGGSYPAAAPIKRIDWLLRAPRSGWRASSARVVPTDASDHRAVLFELQRRR